MKIQDKFKIFLFGLFVLSAAAGMWAAVSGGRGLLEIYRKGVEDDSPAFYSRHVGGVSFDNYAGKANLIVHYYLKAGYPPPAHFPSHTVEWRAFLEVPSAGEYGFRVDCSHPFELSINNAMVLSGPGEYFLRLEKGANEFELKFFNDDGPRGLHQVNTGIIRGRSTRGIPSGRLELLWSVPGEGGWSPVPGRMFSRSDRARGPGVRYMPVFLGLLAAFAMAAADPGFYKKMFLEHRAGIVMACVFLLGFALRFYQHGIIPLYNETIDELGAGWAGWSIINWRVPVSWSGLFDAYGPRRPPVEWFGSPFNIVSPFFDHPPLFHVIAATAAMLGGARELLSVSVSSMRIVPVIFSSFVTILIYLVLKDNYSRRIGILSAFLYALIPTIVVSGRLVQEDNMMVFLVMLALFSYSKNSKNPGWRASVPAALYLGLASLAKFTAVSFVGSFALLYIIRKKWKSALVVLGLGGGTAMLYFLWGALVDWDMFLRVFSAQSGKISQLALPVRMALQPKLIDTVFWDGGIVFIWLSVLCLAFVKKGCFSRDMGVVFGFYYIMICVSVIYDKDFGWYRIMMFPFLCAAGGMVLDELIKERSVLLMVFFIGFALMMNLQAVLPAHVVTGPNFPKLVAGLFLAPVIPAQVWKTRRLKNLALAGILTALLVYGVSSVIMVLNFDQIYYGDPWWGGTL